MITKKNKDLILRYRNRKLAQGVSIPRVQREVGSLRILCEKYDVELEKLKDENFLDKVLAQLELVGYKLNTLNEYKKVIREGSCINHVPPRPCMQARRASNACS